jgi:hypothetical protein
LAEHGLFAKELNTGWAEWEHGGLPVHAGADVAAGAIRCACSLP